MTPVCLEDFLGAAAPETDSQPSYQDGYEAGYQAGFAEAEAARQGLTDALVSSLSGLSQTDAAAAERIMAGLGPLMTALIEQFLPAVARDAIGLQIVEILTAKAAELVQGGLSVQVAPADHGAVMAALAGADLAVAVYPAEGLAPGQAIIGDGQSDDFFDLSEVLAAVQGALAAMTMPATHEANHDT